MKYDDDNIHNSELDTNLSQLASVGQIAAGIAHEVKNPLTAVKGFLQLLQQEEENKYIGIAQSELENALTTLNNLLQVSKPELETEEYQSFYLSVELESILNLFQDKLYDITVVTDFQNTDIQIVGKRSQYKKAFFNLIKNAIEAIDGKGTLTITHSADHQDVIVKIQDNGVGIPEDKIKLLGTPFYSTKDQGTGMGLTQVFSSIYQHGGKINVESIQNEGTTFIIRIPQSIQIKNRGVRNLNLQYDEKFTIKDYFTENRKSFEDRLLSEAVNVRDKIEEIHKIGNINLLSNAYKLVLYVVDEREHELVNFAKQEGMAWAKYSLTLAFKLEWVQAIRRSLWDFLYNWDISTNTDIDRVAFYSLEKKTNELIDQFLTHFFISYSKFKDALIEKQRKLVENLSVPIIPIRKDICILPLIGTIDSVRINTIQDKVLLEIENQHIQTLILDLSGITPLEQDITEHLIRIIDGIFMMGCKTIITGLRSEIVKNIIASNGTLNHQAQFKGTLQVALNDVVFNQPVS